MSGQSQEVFLFLDSRIDSSDESDFLKLNVMAKDNEIVEYTVSRDSKLYTLLLIGSSDREVREQKGIGLPLAVPTLVEDSLQKPMIVYSFFNEEYPEVVFYDIETKRDIIII